MKLHKNPLYESISQKSKSKTKLKVYLSISIYNVIKALYNIKSWLLHFIVGKYDDKKTNMTSIFNCTGNLIFIVFELFDKISF